MAVGPGWGGGACGFQPPRAGLCQRRPSLSKEGNLLSSATFRVEQQALRRSITAQPTHLLASLLQILVFGIRRRGRKEEFSAVGIRDVATIRAFECVISRLVAIDNDFGAELQ